MRKHRRKTHYRQITVAAVAIGAVAVPSVAMACIDQPEDPAAQARHQQWRNANANPWWQAKWGHKPTAGASEAPTAPTAPAAPAAPAAPKAPSAPSTPTATATPSAPASAAPASGATAKVVALVNSERAKVGCSPVTVNAKLTKAAQDHSQDMAAHKNMSHTGSDGSDPGDRITRAGYSWSTYGENVAYGYSTPESVMQGWMTSPGHKANILNCSFKEIGVGLAQPGSYWTQDFGTAR
ncbi:CAP domain-containing protein [Streptomyces sp. NPDC059169]|uniref:CAP domain-containing protein n=1 Tax=Streptomyces sp. NPDC059169 TaxID=3346754 RepID=UPI003690F2F6